MGLFKKKSDPVSERAKTLNQQIAALEAQIKKLSEAPLPPAATVVGASAATPAPSIAPPGSLSSTGTAGPGPGPRLRSTALPHRQPPADAPVSHEPIFEEMHQAQIASGEPVPPPPPADLGTRKSDWASMWQRFMNHFRGPMTSNPKLVSYLAAGSIQGLQPLRYEKRVARNRFIVLVVCLVLVLWGIIAILYSKR